MDFGSRDQLRPLNEPRRTDVRTDPSGQPTAVSREGAHTFTEIESILDPWRIDDEWWRTEVSRMYYQVALSSGTTVTIFQDLIYGGWYFQQTATPADQP